MSRFLSILCLSGLALADLKDFGHGSLAKRQDPPGYTPSATTTSVAATSTVTPVACASPGVNFQVNSDFDTPNSPGSVDYTVQCGSDTFGTNLYDSGQAAPNGYLDCISICEASPDCQAFTFVANRADGTGIGAGNCYLKRTSCEQGVAFDRVGQNSAAYVAGLRPGPAGAVGTTTSPSAAQPTRACAASAIPTNSPSNTTNVYYVQCDIDTEGGLLSVIGNQADYNACFPLCDSTSGCIGFTFTQFEGAECPGYCYLKYSARTGTGLRFTNLGLQGANLVAALMQAEYLPPATSSSVTPTSTPGPPPIYTPPAVTTTTTTTTSTSSTSSSLVPTSSLCPGSNGTVILDSNANTYTLYCGYEYEGQADLLANAPNMQACIDACGARPEDSCLGVSYTGGNSGPGDCYLKTTGLYLTPSPNVICAVRNVAPPPFSTTVTSTSVTSTSTSALETSSSFDITTTTSSSSSEVAPSPPIYTLPDITTTTSSSLEATTSSSSSFADEMSSVEVTTTTIVSSPSSELAETTSSTIAVVSSSSSSTSQQVTFTVTPVPSSTTSISSTTSASTSTDLPTSTLLPSSTPSSTSTRIPPQVTDIPGCAQQCVLDLGNCAAGDVRCICANQPLLESYRQCVVRVCTPADAQDVADYASDLCGDYGVTALPPLNYPTSTSTSTSAPASSPAPPSVTDLPECAQTCVPPDYNGCAAGDVRCICSNQPLLSRYRTCVVQNCNAASAQDTYNFAVELCGNVAVTSLPPLIYPSTTSTTATPSSVTSRPPSVTDIPPCAQRCVLGYGSCSETDVRCICSNTPLLEEYRTCIVGNCNATDAQACFDYAAQLCGGFGVTSLPPLYPSSTTSSSSSRPTGTVASVTTFPVATNPVSCAPCTRSTSCVKRTTVVPVYSREL